MSQQHEQTLNATTRALARDKRISVSFGSNYSASHTQQFYVSALPVWHDSAARSTMRGELDHLALKHRHHSAKLHRSARPPSTQAAKVFDALEDVRVDLLGGASMRGVRHNIHHWRQSNQALKEDGGGKQQDEILAEALASALHFSATNIPPHPHMQATCEHWQQRIEQYAAEPFNAMMDALSNQRQFATHALELMEQLQLLDTASEQQASNTQIDHVEHSEDIDAPNAQQEAEPMDMEQQPVPADSSSVQQQEEFSAHEGQHQMAEEMMDGQAPSASPDHNHSASLADIPDYAIYNKDHDEVVHANRLASMEELQQLNKELGRKLLPLQAAASRMANRLQRMLLAKQRREWLLDQEEGTLDAKRLTRLVTSPTDANYFRQEKDAEFRDTVVTLLIDNSGSMRGRPITIAALSASILGKALERSGVKVELLGFTTRDWKGGQAARSWALAEKPSNPGRLNDLRHIIYKAADQPWRKAQSSLGLMLKEGILKENIDGEAILWAVDRLKKRPEDRRILMVISDGAPVDDSTLSNNHGRYLDQHLREVIARVEAQPDIELLAIGIGHDVTRYYTRAITITEVETLPQVMGGELMDLFAN